MAFIYLASPYTHKKEEVMIKRYLAISEVTAELIRAGEVVYSPIVHCHELAMCYNLPKDFQFWQRYNLGMLDAASRLYVAMLDGWEDSTGVQAEIAYCRDLGKRIFYFDPKACVQDFNIIANSLYAEVDRDPTKV